MKAFITITGLKFHFGSKPFAVGQKVKLVKEPAHSSGRLHQRRPAV